MISFRKTFAVALTALTLGAAALTATEASARGFGHHGGFRSFGGFHRHVGGHRHFTFHRHFTVRRHYRVWHSRYYYRPAYRTYVGYTGGYGSCWRWVRIPGFGFVRKNVCRVYRPGGYYVGGTSWRVRHVSWRVRHVSWRGHGHWGGHRHWGGRHFAGHFGGRRR